MNNLLIADLAIFREWINNNQRTTTTPLSVVYQKIVEPLVFAWTNIVTHY